MIRLSFAAISADGNSALLTRLTRHPLSTTLRFLSPLTRCRSTSESRAHPHNDTAFILAHSFSLLLFIIKTSLRCSSLRVQHHPFLSFNITDSRAHGLAWFSLTLLGRLPSLCSTIPTSRTQPRAALSRTALIVPYQRTRCKHPLSLIPCR